MNNPILATVENHYILGGHFLHIRGSQHVVNLRKWGNPDYSWLQGDHQVTVVLKNIEIDFQLRTCRYLTPVWYIKKSDFTRNESEV